MKRYKYSCDGGCIKIGNEQFNVHITNGYGDGTFYVYIGTEKEIKKVRHKDSQFIGSARGQFNIYSYDCDEEVLCELCGLYAISRNDGTIYLERWE